MHSILSESSSIHTLCEKYLCKCLTQLLGVQMEACLVAIPSHETVVDFAFYKAAQVALLLKDKARISHGGSTDCRLVIFPLTHLPFMLLNSYSNGTNQLSQHVFEVNSTYHCLEAITDALLMYFPPGCSSCLSACSNVHLISVLARRGKVTNACVHKAHGSVLAHRHA